MLEHHQFRPLDVDLEEVELVDVEVVETMSLDVDLFDDQTPLREPSEQSELIDVGCEKARHAFCSRDFQPMRLTVANDVREIPLHRPLAPLQLRQRVLLRLETGCRAN